MDKQLPNKNQVMVEIQKSFQEGKISQINETISIYSASEYSSILDKIDDHK